MWVLVGKRQKVVSTNVVEIHDSSKRNRIVSHMLYLIPLSFSFLGIEMCWWSLKPHARRSNLALVHFLYFPLWW